MTVSAHRPLMQLTDAATRCIGQELHMGITTVPDAFDKSCAGEHCSTLPVRPVQLIEVNVVCLQTPEAVVQGCCDVGCVKGGGAAPDPGHLGRGPGNLASNQHLVPARSSSSSSSRPRFIPALDKTSLDGK